MSRVSYICPYCFSKHQINEVDFRCMNLRCKSQKGEAQVTYFPSQVESSFYMPEVSVCPICNQETGTRVCPDCHNTLPSTIDIDNDIIISVIGTKDCGKSSYLGVLLHEIKQRYALSFNSAVSFIDKENSNEYERRYGQYLYPFQTEVDPRRISKLAQTGKQANTFANLEDTRPILLDMKMERKGFFNQIRIPYTFIFYDSIGEVLENQEAMFTMARNISKSRGIIFLMDPLQIPKVRNQLSEQVIVGASNLEAARVNGASELLLRVASLIRAQNRINENKKITIPIAVTLCKLDVVKELLPSNLWMLRESPHLKNGLYVEQDGWDVKEEVQGVLSEWGQQEFLKQLEFNFSKYQLCGCSAFGNNPKENGSMQIPRPHRMEDGLLWILKENLVIESKG